MIEVITGIFANSYDLLVRMAPYLLFGFLIAGIMRIFLDTQKISNSLGGSTFSNNVKASLFGIPLPLCSCSVIPAAMSLRKEGASEGSTLSFLISTPATGVDSIFTTYSLLGGLFTIYRVLASFIAGVFAGVVSNLFKGVEKNTPPDVTDCEKCSSDVESKARPEKLVDNVRNAFVYAFNDLVSENAKPILLGILIGGLLSYFLPEEVISRYLGAGIMPMLFMLAFSIPMYVCANASVPIAAALMYRGLAPGAAFVFLLAGPATNIVTISVVAKNLGKKALIIYLGSIIVSGLFLGTLLNRIFQNFGLDPAVMAEGAHAMVPVRIGILSAAVLLILFSRVLLKNLVGRKK